MDNYREHEICDDIINIIFKIFKAYEVEDIEKFSEYINIKKAVISLF